MQDRKPWPIDIEPLQKGDVVTANEIESAYRIKRTDKKYPLVCLSVCELISQTKAMHGVVFTVVSDKDNVRILTDAEASEYNYKKHRQSCRRIVQAHARNVAVDVAALSDHERHKHERRLTVQGATIQALAETNRRLPLTSFQRALPGVVEQEKQPGRQVDSVPHRRSVPRV